MYSGVLEKNSLPLIFRCFLSKISERKYIFWSNQSYMERESSNTQIFYKPARAVLFIGGHNNGTSLNLHVSFSYTLSLSLSPYKSRFHHFNEKPQKQKLLNFFHPMAISTSPLSWPSIIILSLSLLIGCNSSVDGERKAVIFVLFWILFHGSPFLCLCLSI